MSLSRWLIYRKITKALYTRPCIVTVFDKFLISCYSRIKVCIARSLDMFYDTNMFICLFQNRKKMANVCLFYCTRNYYLCLCLCVSVEIIGCVSLYEWKVKMYVENYSGHIFWEFLGYMSFLDRHVFKRETFWHGIKTCPIIFWSDLIYK